MNQPINITIPEDAWEDSSVDVEGGRLMLKGGLLINGRPVHLEAIAVEDAESGEQVAVDPVFADDVNNFQTYSGCRFVTETIGQREYIFVLTMGSD